MAKVKGGAGPPSTPTSVGKQNWRHRLDISLDFPAKGSVAVG